MERILIGNLNDHIGKEVEVFGWVSVRRDHGKLIFIDLRDRTGFIQTVILPKPEELHTVGEKLRSEWVVSIKGIVNSRPENMVNDGPNGKIELLANHIDVLNEATILPFDINQDTRNIGEEIRLKYRYFDLKSSRLQDNIRRRHKTTQYVRNYLSEENFIEVETPLLTKSTPEGARDYLVPSRIDRGNFYALPQSPQQYKQLLMAGGIERYFQFAKCMRDEDTRGDRQPEFTQMDLEMSFVDREDVMKLTEDLIIKLVTDLYPEKHIQETPFPRMSYKEAIEKYGSDRPDIRKDKNDPNLLAFVWVIDFPFFEKNEKGGWTFTHNPFSMPKKEYIEDLIKKENIAEILTTQYDIVLNGFEIGGGSIRSHKPEILSTVFEIMGFEPDRIEGNFGHMLEAFKTGVPPHGGLAWGFDRLMMILLNEPNIREVIAFPKTGEGKDLMMSAPSKAEPEQLMELGITFRKEDK
jgi:aspartyl-tRNA synthetase